MQAIEANLKPTNKPSQPAHTGRPNTVALSLPAVPVFQAKVKDKKKTIQFHTENGQLSDITEPESLPAIRPFPIQKKKNNTGLPDNLKAGVEHLSGFAMDDVKVYYNSSKPATLQAHAYAQGTDIHLAPGQEKHLPHEAWHVAQQKQGRVKPTLQMKGVAVNDDSGLEKEADVMGKKALQLQGYSTNISTKSTQFNKNAIIQRAGNTDAWNQYTRQANDNVNGQALPADVRQRINLNIQNHIRTAADRYKNVYISFGGNPIVISSQKALFHFSLDITEAGAQGSHFTFETYNAGKWLNTGPNSVWQTQAVTDVVESPKENEQWLLERAGDRGMLTRLKSALELHYHTSHYVNLTDGMVDEKIASILADRATMTGLNQGVADHNPLHNNNEVPPKGSTDSHWRAAPAAAVLPAQANPENIPAIWTRLKDSINARVTNLPGGFPAGEAADIIAQTDHILNLGLMIYKRLNAGAWAGTTLANFQEAAANRTVAEGYSINRTSNAFRLANNDVSSQITRVADQAVVDQRTWRTPHIAEDHTGTSGSTSSSSTDSKKSE